MTKILVVYNYKTKKILPFQIVPPYGEINVLASGPRDFDDINSDNIRVNMIDASYIDFDTMTIIGDEYGKEIS